jgi:hypothetical protein
VLVLTWGPGAVLSLEVFIPQTLVSKQESIDLFTFICQILSKNKNVKQIHCSYQLACSCMKLQ